MMNAADDVYTDSECDVTTPLLGGSQGPAGEPQPGSGKDDILTALLEPPEKYKSRWQSIRVMYLVMFLGSVTFTITMSSLWPFLQVLNPAATASFLGWVVAAYSLGQLVASPFFGGWANLRSSSREPLAVSLILTVLSNVFYMYLESIPIHSEYFMILARGLIGFSAGNVAVVRSYVSGATTVQERTGSMANLSIFQAMGFILGPVIQAALVPISYPGLVNTVYFHFNMYTAPAFFAACVAVISLFLLVFVFREHRVLDDDDIKAIVQSGGGDAESSGALNDANLLDSIKQLKYKPDYVAVISTNLLFFVVLFMFTVFETIGTPLTMHMYAWTKTKATLYQGIILGVAGVLSIIVFMIVKILAKKFNERYLLLGGFIFCLCGYFVFVPWGNQLPPRGVAPINHTVSSAEAIFSLSSHIINGREPEDMDTVHVLTRRDVFSLVEHHYPPYIQHFVVPGLHKTSESEDLLVNDTSHLQGNPHITDNKNQGLTESEDLLANATVQSYVHMHITDNKNQELTKTKLSAVPMLVNNPATHDLTATTTEKTDTTTNSYNSTASTTYEPNGCPWQYDWCGHVPVIYLGQFLGGTVLISIGYPTCNMLSYTVYSKLLGPKPQGLWMGWLTASGSLARTVGPVYVSQIYDSFGPQITFGSCCGLIVVTIVFYLVVFHRMVPFSLKDESLTRFGSSNRFVN